MRILFNKWKKPRLIVKFKVLKIEGKAVTIELTHIISDGTLDTTKHRLVYDDSLEIHADYTFNVLK